MLAVLPAADVSVGAEMARVVLSLAGIIGLILAAGWLSRRLQARTQPGGRRIRCVESFAVGARERMLLIDADGKRLLVGVGPGGMRTLHVYDGQAPAPSEPLPVSVPTFADVLGRWKRKP